MEYTRSYEEISPDITVLIEETVIGGSDEIVWSVSRNGEFELKEHMNSSD